MRQFLKGTRFRVFVGIIAVLLICSVIAVAVNSRTSPVSAAFGTVFSPVMGFATGIKQKLDGLSFGQKDQLESENFSLREQLAEAESRLADYDDIKYRLTSYETMLGLKSEHPDYELAYANIIGTDSRDVFSSLIIDKGSLDGISVNDPVVYGSYAIGVVRSVKPTYSVVWTLLNPAVNVSAFESATRETGYVTTDASLSAQGKYMLPGLHRDTLAAAGDVVCTSGIGGVYPKGLIIGSVAEVIASKVDVSSYATVEPAVVISDLQDVFVITAFEGQGIEEIVED